jgi:hypothetical protein
MCPIIRIRNQGLEADSKGINFSPAFISYIAKEKFPPANVKSSIYSSRAPFILSGAR